MARSLLYVKNKITFSYGNDFDVLNIKIIWIKVRRYASVLLLFEV